MGKGKVFAVQPITGCGSEDAARAAESMKAFVTFMEEIGFEEIITPDLAFNEDNEN